MSTFDKMFGGSRKVKTASIPSAMVPIPMGGGKEMLISLLQEDLKLEYTAALQYLQHYAVMQGAEFDSIRKHIKEHADQEMEHAVTVADRIVKLGAEPVISLDEIKVSPESVTMLEQDLSGEQTAIQRYKQRIVQAMSLGEFGAADELMDILVDEEEHEQDLLTSLGGRSQESTSIAVSVAVEPAQGSGYVSDDAKVKELEKSREERRVQVFQKLASLKKA